jgi:outer membrane protein OmpA-like peptidoglycan-associated protein
LATPTSGWWPASAGITIRPRTRASATATRTASSTRTTTARPRPRTPTGFEDEDGCPEEDNDEDGIVDDKDECPDLPEEEGGDGDGCPEKTYVKIEGGQMEIFGKIRFKTGSAEVDKKSDPLLDQIAAAMKANPQVKKVRVEGHTDDVGGSDLNQRLSEERAASVKSSLESRGVDDDRLDSKGYGESRPTAPNRTAAGRAKNRRVEFIITESD